MKLFKNIKKLLTVSLIAVTMSIGAQTYQPPVSPIIVPVEISNDYFPQGVRIILSNIAAVSLDAIGDGLRDEAKYTHDSQLSKWGHLANAGSVGVLVSVPLGQGFTFREWCIYAASYSLTRAAIFDPIYNKTRGLPWGYTGQSSNWDAMLNKLNAPDGEVVMRAVSFSVAVSLPLQSFHIKNRRAQRNRYKNYNSTLIVYPSN